MKKKIVFLLIGKGEDEYEDEYMWVEAVHETEQGAKKHLKELQAQQKEEENDDLADCVNEYHISRREVDE